MIETKMPARPSRARTAIDFFEEVVPLTGIALLIGFGLRYAGPENTHPKLAVGLGLFGAVTGGVRFLSRGWADGSPSTELARWICGGLVGGLTVASFGLLEPQSFQVNALPFGAALGILTGLGLGLGEQRHTFTPGGVAPRTATQIRRLWTVAGGAVALVAGLLALAYRAV